jgi:hypothetical protein
MPTSTFIMNIIDILSHLVPSFPPILHAVSSQLHAPDTRHDITTTPASPQNYEHPKPIPPKLFLSLISSNPSFKNAVTDPLLSFESSATSMAHVSLGVANAPEGRPDDANGYGCGRKGEHELERDIDISTSLFNVSLVNDTSTSTSTPSSSTDDLSLSLPLPPHVFYP